MKPIGYNSLLCKECLSIGLVFSAVLEVNKCFFAMNFEGKSTFYRR